MQITEKTRFPETFLFSKITLWKKKTLTSLVNYSTLYSWIEITFQNKEKYSTQYNYSILQFEYFFLTNFTTTRVCTHTSCLPEKLVAARSPEAVTKYKLAIPIKGIMILVFWEKSFKSMEADYSNRLASPLVASSGETSPSPRIYCDKIKYPHQRCQFLGTHNLRTARV